ncbi:MAG: transglycosylase SLT domain-containing protein, partial [Pseudomonadota bacterium]
MKFDGFIKSRTIYILLILTIFLGNIQQVSGEPPAQIITQASTIPSLIECIRIKEPLYFCGEPVPINNQDVLERLEKELLLAIWDKPQVILWLKRANRYMPFIEESLKKDGLPDDLKYIVVAESGMRPHIGSPKGALGFWQFIESTGNHYGLAINDNIDERRNIEASTRAAISYLKNLYSIFNSWTLAAAAYNMGEYGLKKEIEIQEVNDYYLLYLSIETQRYLFRILAAKLILSNPARYGFDLLQEDLYHPYECDRVDIYCSQNIPVTAIAKAAFTYFKMIKDLNPQIRGYYLPSGTHSLLIPKGTAEGFNTRLQQFVNISLAHSQTQQPSPKKLVHIVDQGDSLTLIARRYNVSVNSLLRWNKLKQVKHIHPGDRIVV